MERVHETVHDPRYDLVVVDTPPAQSSIEILDAPVRLVRFLDQRVVRWFLQASGDASKRGRDTLAQRLLRTVAGDSLVSALTEFLTEMAFLREGFAERAKEVQTLLRSPNASFILVSSADSVGLEAARSVADEVAGRGFQLSHVAFNRAFIPQIELSANEPVSLPDGLDALRPKVESMRARLIEEEARKRANVRAFRRDHDARAWVLPEATRPLGDPSALAAWFEGARAVDVER